MQSFAEDFSRWAVDPTSLRTLAEGIPNVFFTASAEDAACASLPLGETAHPDDARSLGESWERAKRTADVVTGVVRFEESAGRYRRHDVRVAPLCDLSGRVLCWIGTKTPSALDVAPLEPAQHISELVRAVCTATDDAIFIKDLEGRYLYANPSCAKLFGVPVDQVVGRTDEDWFGPVVAARLRTEDARAVAAGVACNGEETLTFEGATSIFSTTKAPYIDSAGKAVGVIGIARNVTASRNTERTIRAERDMYKTMATVVPGAFASHRLRTDGTLETPYTTPSIVDLFGATPEELAADPTIVETRTHPDDRDRVAVALRASASDLSPFRCDFRVAHPTRGEIWVEVISGCLREPDGSTLWHGFVLDVTDRKRDERELLAQRDRIEDTEATLRAIVDTVPDILILIGRDGKIRFINHLLPGYRMEDVVGSDSSIYIAPEMREQTARIMERVFETGKMQTHETAALAADGELQWFNTRYGPVIQDGEVVAVTLACTDITTRKTTEIALRGSEERYRKLVDLLPDAVVVTVGPKVSFCNEAFVRLMAAKSSDELLGLTPFDLFHPDDHANVRARIAYMNEHDEAVPAIEQSIVGIDGVRRPVSVVATPLEQGIESATLVVLHDLTEQKKLEEQFRQAHKMEAFGQLAGGVAHDFNNLLTVILGETELLVSTLPQDDPSLESLSDIHDAGQRAAGLTRQLLAFSRKTVLEPKVLDINVVVRETEKMLRRLIGEDILLSTRLAANLEHVNVDPGQLNQVLMNLSVNARDAMPKGGRLEIETSNVALDEVEGHRRGGLGAGMYVRLCVKDSGTGMSADVRARLFQPFFTTKGVGKGTGLGLAVVHGIVIQSGGAIAVESAEGEGTTFEILLPAATLARPIGRRQRAMSMHQGTETVLVVEDDDAVRRLATRTLSAKGYRILLAHDGVEAMKVLEQEGSGVDLVITDVVMPKMDGRELGERLRDRFPTTKMLYVSGYTDDMLVRRGLQCAEVEFLAKPYTPVSLVHAVRRVLAKP